MSYCIGSWATGFFPVAVTQIKCRWRRSPAGLADGAVQGFPAPDETFPQKPLNDFAAMGVYPCSKGNPLTTRWPS